MAKDSPALEAGPEVGRAPFALRMVMAVAAGLLGYVLVAGVVCGLERLGMQFGVRGLGIAGLALDAVLLGVLVRWLGSKGSPLTGVLGPLLALLLVILFFAVGDLWFNRLGGGFWSLRNLQTVAAQTMTVAVAALGMTMIIIAGGIDLSAGTALALCATVLAWSLDSGQAAWLAIVACVGTGVACGTVNGALISLLRVVPFIITLGTMRAILGVGNLVAKETTVRPNMTEDLQWLPQMVTPVPDPLMLVPPLLPNFAWGVWLAIGLAITAGFLLRLTVFGRYVFAIGSNEAAARLCGVPVARVKIAVYALAGVFVGMAGVYQFARLSSGSPTSGLGLELKVIAAVVIGGGSLSGGRGSVIGTLCGAAIMQVIESGCTALDLRNPIQDIILGAIIVAAVTIDRFRQSRLG